MYVGSWIIPVIATAYCLFMMVRPYQSSGDYDFGMIFRLGWMIPIGFVWALYFGVMLAIKTWF